MFKKLLKKKDEFTLFLEEAGIEDIYSGLTFEERETFKDACYVGVTVDSSGETRTGKLINFRERDGLIWLISSNLINRKEYELALKILNSGIPDTANRVDRAQYNIAYALAYEKLKDVEKCNYHCWKAIELLHDGDYAYKRLIINYVKLKEYEKALEVCNIALERKDVFHENTWKSLSEYANKRKQFLLKQINKTN